MRETGSVWEQAREVDALRREVHKLAARNYQARDAQEMQHLIRALRDAKQTLAQMRRAYTHTLWTLEVSQENEGN